MTNLRSREDLIIIIEAYEAYAKVSGLTVNIRKSQILFINTDPNLINDVQGLGLQTVTQMRYLGIQIADNLSDTIKFSYEVIDVKAIRKKILATSPPTDMLHRSMLVNIALTSLYTHAVMSVPVTQQVTDKLTKLINDFLWTRQEDGRPSKKDVWCQKKELGQVITWGVSKFKIRYTRVRL